MKSIIMAEKSIRATDTERRPSIVPNSPEAAPLIMDALSERRIMVAPRRKLVMMVALKFAASTSILG